MKALLLIGGQATRLYPLSKYTAKSLLPICDRELLHYQVSQIARAGIGEIALAAGYLVDQLREHVRDYEGIDFHISIEPEPRGTAGAIAQARDWLDGEPVLVLNADILTTVDLGKVIAAHQKAKRVATLVGRQVADPARFGLLDVDGNAIKGFSEKPESAVGGGPFFINAGTYILEADVYETIPYGQCVSIERETFPLMLKEHGELTHYSFEGLWHDIGTFESYFTANFDLLGRRYVEGDDSLWGERDDCAIFKDLIMLAKSVALGKQVDLYHRVIVMREVVIGDNCRLENTIVMPGANIGSGTRLTNCIVCTSAGIPEGTRADNSLFVEGEEVIPFYPLAKEA